MVKSLAIITRNAIDLQRKTSEFEKRKDVLYMGFDIEYCISKGESVSNIFSWQKQQLELVPVE